jgi:hypothetical protein
MLIGISGNIASGKDTVVKIWQSFDRIYNYIIHFDKKRLDIIGVKAFNFHNDVKLIEKWLIRNEKIPIIFEWEHKKFATKLKQICAILFNCDVADFESLDFKNSFLPEEWQTNESKKTYRYALQTIGTNLFREMWNKNTWVISTLSEYKPTDKWIISDARFKNELDAIKSSGGYVIKIERGEKTTSTHTSETELNEYSNWDFMIDNNKDFPHLIEQVKDIMIKLGVITIPD